MKQKIGLTSLLVMCVLMIWANPVGKKAAQQTAQEFMMQQLSSEGSRRAPQMVAVEAVQGDWQNDALYLFNAADGQGFVVVSGDDRTAPILGYSTSGRLDVDKMPSNLRSWLQHYAAQIAYIQKYDINVPKRAIQNCGDPIASTLTSRWNQSPIYNDECPLVYHFMDQACTTPYVYKDEHGQPTSAPLRAVTGCGATALAQILYYHKYPAAITAAIPAQENMVVQQMSTAGYPIYNFYSDPGVAAGTTIDWANMKDVYGYTINESNIQIPENPVTTTAERKAVADLMHYCAAALDMRYGTTQTGGSEARSHGVLMTRENLRLLANDSQRRGQISPLENLMIGRVLSLQTRTAAEIMTPMGRASTIRRDATMGDVAALARKTGHMRFPVMADDGTRCLGILHVADILAHITDDPQAPISSRIRPAFHVKAAMRADDVLPLMRRRRERMAIVRDKSAAPLGIVTSSSILDRVVRGG